MTNVLAPLAKVDCNPAFDATPIFSKIDTISTPLEEKHKEIESNAMLLRIGYVIFVGLQHSCGTGSNWETDKPRGVATQNLQENSDIQSAMAQNISWMQKCITIPLWGIFDTTEQNSK